MLQSCRRGNRGRAGGAAVGLLVPLVPLALAVAAARPAPPRAAAAGPSASSSVRSSSRAVFERRIRPLLLAKNPSSCSECHLSGVDLKDYIRPSEAETFLALRRQRLVDLKRPDDSRILSFIKMSRPRTERVTQSTRDVEYGAFRDWIAAASRDPRLSGPLPVPTRNASRGIGPPVPDAVIRHARIDSVVASFERNVWSQEGRCMNCHQPDNQKNIAQYGSRVAWFVPDDPEATMRKLIAQGDVNLDKPEESLLLLKPLNKVPHGGGEKMRYGDAGYKLFRAWLEDYAKSVKGGYRTAQDLPGKPTEALVYLNAILNVSGGPKAWINKLARVDVYPWDAERGAWATTPAATGERSMFGGKENIESSTNLIMFAIIPDAADAAARKAAEAEQRARLTSGGGRYLLKYYCDTAERLNQDYTVPTDSASFFQGQQEVTVASWSGGWGRPVKVKVTLANP